MYTAIGHSFMFVTLSRRGVLCFMESEGSEGYYGIGSRIRLVAVEVSMHLHPVRI